MPPHLPPHLVESPIAGEDNEKTEIEAGLKLARSIATRITAIPELPMRTAALSDILSRLTPQQLVEVFHVILEGHGKRDPLFVEAHDSLTDFPTLIHKIGNSIMSEVYTVARRRNYSDVVLLLQSGQPLRAPTKSQPPREDPKIKELSLGERKSLARAHDLDLLNRILHDQNPPVIRNLLRNPHITVRQVVAIAAKRPTTAAVLNEVAANTKWNVNYNVRRALLFNPYTPTQTATRFVGQMLRQDLMDICRTGSIHETIRSAALMALRARDSVDNVENESLDGVTLEIDIEED